MSIVIPCLTRDPIIRNLCSGVLHTPINTQRYEKPHPSLPLEKGEGLKSKIFICKPPPAKEGAGGGFFQIYFTSRLVISKAKSRDAILEPASYSMRDLLIIHTAMSPPYQGGVRGGLTNYHHPPLLVSRPTTTTLVIPAKAGIQVSQRFRILALPKHPACHSRESGNPGNQNTLLVIPSKAGIQ